MKYIILLTAILMSCIHTNEGNTGPKFEVGDCATIKPEAVPENRYSDGTPFKVLNIVENKYTVLIYHSKLGTPVFFQATTRKFDFDFEHSSCKGVYS